MELLVIFLGMMLLAGPVLLMGPWARRTPSDELHALDERFARGQIDADEYRYWHALLLDDERRAAAKAGPRP